MAESDQKSGYRPDPDAIHQETVNNEFKAVIQWEKEWGFLVDLYKKCQEDAARTNVFRKEERSELVERPADTRKLPDYPRTAAGHIGWLAGRPEFNHERFGMEVRPVRTLYKSLGWPMESCP